MSERLHRHWRIVAAVLATAWLVALVVASLQGERPPAFSRSQFHRQMHWLIFGGTAALLCALARTWRQKCAVALALTGLGLGLELLQRAIYATGGIDWQDVGDDAVASVFVCVLSIWMSARAGTAAPPTRRPPLHSMARQSMLNGDTVRTSIDSSETHRPEF